MLFILKWVQLNNSSGDSTFRYEGPTQQMLVSRNNLIISTTGKLNKTRILLVFALGCLHFVINVIKNNNNKKKFKRKTRLCNESTVHWTHEKNNDAVANLARIIRLFFM